MSAKQQPRREDLARGFERLLGDSAWEVSRPGRTMGAPAKLRAVVDDWRAELEVAAAARTARQELRELAEDVPRLRPLIRQAIARSAIAAVARDRRFSWEPIPFREAVLGRRAEVPDVL